MKMSDEMKKDLKTHLGYNDNELQEFLENPRNIDVLSKTLDLMSKTIIAEVIESHGCNSRHKVGDKFYFDGSGNLLTKLSPKRICIYALSELDKLIHSANELLYAGINPNEMRFNQASCFDSGLKCGGWGNIVMRLSVIERNKLK